MPTTQTVPLFGRAVPAPALTLLLHLEDEGFDVRVDASTRELCITPTVPAPLRRDITRYKAYLVLMVEQVLLLLERERAATQDDNWELV